MPIQYLNAKGPLWYKVYGILESLSSFMSLLKKVLTRSVVRDKALPLKLSVTCAADFMK
jgi:hypothetical protein